MQTYKVIGVMSGTSLDGLDLAYCEFRQTRGKWKVKIGAAVTLKYSPLLKRRLSSAFYKGSAQINKLDEEFGQFIGKEVTRFILKYKLKPDLVASHGHTVFHRPSEGITLQIGSGREIAKKTRLLCINNFRIGDVKLGGQGAPLVPMADHLLYSDFDYCLNLGGFANVSFIDARKRRVAFDICPVNIILNELAMKCGKEFDKDGILAASGTLKMELLTELNRLKYYKRSWPKSLGREWVDKEFKQVLAKFRIPLKDKIRTVTEHAAIQIITSCRRKGSKPNVLLTGGGTYNQFLISRLKEGGSVKVVLPDDKTIQFKEAMAFAFLGVLRLKGKINILKSVTGARRNSSGGEIHFPD